MYENDAINHSLAHSLTHSLTWVLDSSTGGLAARSAAAYYKQWFIRHVTTPLTHSLTYSLAMTSVAQWLYVTQHSFNHYITVLLRKEWTYL